MSDGWIYVPNWKRFQHYKKRRPSWIKVYMDLLHKDEYLALSAADRGVLHGIWLLISVTGDGRLSANRTTLGRQLNVRRVSLEPLIQAGFIEIRLAKAESPASTEGEVSNETKTSASKTTPEGSSAAPVDNEPVRDPALADNARSMLFRLKEVM